MNKECMNLKINNCSGFVTEKGNVLCDSCLEEKKKISKIKREHDIEELVNKNLEMEKELFKLRELNNNLDNDFRVINEKNEENIKRISELEAINKSLELRRKKIEINYKTLEEKFSEKTAENKYLEYLETIEKENKEISNMNERLIKENEEFVKKTEIFDTTYLQLKLDNERLYLNNIRLVDKLENLQKNIGKLKENTQDKCTQTDFQNLDSARSVKSADSDSVRSVSSTGDKKTGKKSVLQNIVKQIKKNK